MIPKRDDSPQVLYRLWPNGGPTPLIPLPKLAQRCRVAAAWVKDESRRPLGSFKALGGVYASLRVLARAVGLIGIEELVRRKLPGRTLPMLVCASDGNHGLAVAAAAEMAGASARVYLHRRVPDLRAARIAERGAEIIWIVGTYDDAVDAAAAAARRGEGLLISDTSADADDAVVTDVMAGYALMADEIVEQMRSQSDAPPTHLFVQAGVGGLAAALARGLCEAHGMGCRIVVAEPERAACVAAALQTGRVVRLPGDLHTAAEMLSCGEASVPAVTILHRLGAGAVAVSERALSDAVTTLAECGGPATTPSGACGLAALLACREDSLLTRRFGIDEQSRVLLIATERASLDY